MSANGSIVGTFGYAPSAETPEGTGTESIYEMLRRSRLQAAIAEEATNNADSAATSTTTRWWYLPQEVNGVTVLVNPGGFAWQSTNDALQSSTFGLAYRMSKDDSDKANEILPWGQMDVGIDEGDGWVKFIIAEEVNYDSMRANHSDGTSASSGHMVLASSIGAPLSVVPASLPYPSRLTEV